MRESSLQPYIFPTVIMTSGALLLSLQAIFILLLLGGHEAVRVGEQASLVERAAAIYGDPRQLLGLPKGPSGRCSMPWGVHIGCFKFVSISRFLRFMQDFCRLMML